MHSKPKKIFGILFGVFMITAVLGLTLGFFGKYLLTDSVMNEESEEPVIITEINNEEDYLAFAHSLNKDNVYTGQVVNLYADLNFSQYENIPVIGVIEGESSVAEFNGIFDGNGHKISGIQIARTDGVAAMFGKLTGTVKNLKVEACSFTGTVSGAIAADNSSGAVLNCYVDATVSGDVKGIVVGRNYGAVLNCMTSAEACGENYGKMRDCYLNEAQNVPKLNESLQKLRAEYDDSDFLLWDESADCMLGNENAEMLDKLIARLETNGQELILEAYYSTVDEQWFFALPAGFEKEELFIEAVGTNGNITQIKKRAGEHELEFEWMDETYKVAFVSSDQIETLYVTLKEDLKYVHANKKEELPGKMLILDTEGNSSYANIKGFYGHGNDSWKAPKKSYNLKFDSKVNLLGMGADEDYVLLAGFRENSLMSYVISGEMAKLVGFDYAPEFRLVNLYVGGKYLGVYYLTEKLEIDENRIDIDHLYEETKRVNGGNLEDYEINAWTEGESSHIRYYYNVAKNPTDITGGYLLERDFDDYEKSDSRFTTEGKKSRIVLKRARFSSWEQVSYIAQFWQNFEDGLFAEDGYNKEGRHFTEYINLESFAKQWLMYELSMESSIRSSVYYYKESDVTGDGLLHACYPWDVERSFVMKDTVNEFGSVAKQDEYWAAYYQHMPFREEAAHVWKEEFIPAIDFMLSESSKKHSDGVKNLGWYESNIEEINKLENSRWNANNMLDKCDMIRDILDIRKEVLTDELNNYGVEH